MRVRVAGNRRQRTTHRRPPRITRRRPRTTLRATPPVTPRPTLPVMPARVHIILRAYDLLVVLRTDLHHGLLRWLVPWLLVESSQRTPVGFAINVCRLLRSSLLGRLCAFVLGWLCASLFDMFKLLDVRCIRPQRVSSCTANYAPACSTCGTNYVTSYAPACSSCSSCGTQQVTLRPACGCDSCGSTCQSGCGCSAEAPAVQASYQAPVTTYQPPAAGCSNCSASAPPVQQTIAQAPQSGTLQPTPAPSTYATQQQPQPTPATQPAAADQRPTLQAPQQTSANRPADTTPSTVQPEPGTDSKSPSPYDVKKSGDSSTYLEAPQLFQKDRTAQRGSIAPVRTALYQQPVSYRQTATAARGPVTAAQAATGRCWLGDASK